MSNSAEMDGFDALPEGWRAFAREFGLSAGLCEQHMSDGKTWEAVRAELARAAMLNETQRFLTPCEPELLKDEKLMLFALLAGSFKAKQGSMELYCLRQLASARLAKPVEAVRKCCEFEATARGRRLGEKLATERIEAIRAKNA